MNCWNHPNRAAVATCHVCHKSYCKSCIELSTHPGSEPLCPACLCSNNKTYLADLKMEMDASVKSLKSAKIFYLLGLAFLLISFLVSSGLNGGIIVGAILMGIPAFKTGVRFAAYVERNNPERYVQTDSGYRKGIWNAGFGTFVFNVIICVILGIIITPIRMIKLYNSIKQMDAQISTIETTWFWDSDLQTFLAEGLEDGEDAPAPPSQRSAKLSIKPLPANIDVKCPHCNLELQAPTELVGQEVQCPTCQNAFVIKKN